MRGLIFCFLLVGTTLLGAETEMGTVWCVGDSVKVHPNDPPQNQNTAWDGPTHTLTLYSAKNEYVAFQIIVQASEAALNDVTVIPADFQEAQAAVIPKANIDLFVEHYLNVTVSSREDANKLFPFCTPGEHPTQIVPFQATKYGAPFPVGPKRNQPVWVDVYVPADAVAGDYQSTFLVKAGTTILSEIHAHLKVWNFALPEQTHFRSFLYTGPENLRWGHRLGGDMNTPDWIALEDAYFQMAHQHRLNFHPSTGDIINEIGQRYAKYYDGSGFTQRVGKGVGQNTVCMSPETSDETQFKRLCQESVAIYEHNHMNALAFAYIWDEPHDAEDFAVSKQHCKWLHETVGNKLNTFIATPHWQNYEPGDVNIYSETTISDIPNVLARGDSVWAVNAGYAAGPYVDSPGYGGRSIVWMNWKMNLGGWQFWDVCYWVDKQNRKHKENGKWVRDFSYGQVNRQPEKYMEDLWNDPLNFDETRKQGYKISDAIRINGDGILFYPGYDVGIAGPIASFALKSLRRGAQDYEYLWLLKQAGKSAELQAIVDTQCPAPGVWNNEIESWEKARIALGQLLDQK